MGAAYRATNQRAPNKKKFLIALVFNFSSVTVGCTADRNGDIICYVHLVKLRSFAKLYVLPSATVLRKPELCISLGKGDVWKIGSF